MVFRIGPACSGLLLLGMEAGCVDHPMATEPGPECGIRRATVYLDSRITLPEWEASRNPDPALESRWSGFLP